MVTARSWAAKDFGALNLIDSFDSDSAPLAAFELVVIATWPNPPIFPDKVKLEAPLAASLFETT